MKKKKWFMLILPILMFFTTGCEKSTKVKKPEHLARANQIFNIDGVTASEMRIYSFPYKNGEMIVNSQGGVCFIPK